MDLTLRPLNILIGPNGAGKSNLIKFFRFMAGLVNRDLQVHVRTVLGGADNVLHFSRKVTERIKVDLYFFPNSYHCELAPTPTGELAFRTETGFYYSVRRSARAYGGKSEPVCLASPGSEESGLPSLDERWNLKGRWIARHISDWRRYHFDDTSDAAKVKQWQSVDRGWPLAADAGNLASFLWNIRTTPEYEQIVEVVRRVSPTFQDFILEPTPTRQIRLQWKHRGVDLPFDVFQLSDGTLRFICLATLLLQPEPPSVVVLDEPELGLHPYAIALLAGMMRSASVRTQLVVATQSVTLANQFAPEDLIVVETHDNASCFERLSADRLESWLEEYRMGDLWEKNLIGGTPG